MDINFKIKMNKQSGAKYTSLMNTIAAASLATLGLIYIGGWTLSFSEVVSKILLGDTIATDFIYLVLDCLAQFLSVLLPIKLFHFMHSGAYNDDFMPVEKNILSKRAIPYVFLLGLSATFIVAILSTTFVDTFIGDYSQNDDYLWRTGMKYNYQIFIYLFGTAVIPAVVEELFCRKAMCNALLTYGPKTAIIVSSLVFALLHANFSKFIFTFVLGIFTGWLYVGTKSLKLPIIMHFINNLLGGFSIVLYYRVSPDAYASFVAVRFLICIPVAIVCLLCLIKHKNTVKSERIQQAILEGTYEEYLEYEKKYSKSLEMLPNEEGEEVIPLTAKEKTKGFFSPIMIIYLIICIILAITKIVNI